MKAASMPLGDVYSAPWILAFLLSHPVLESLESVLIDTAVCVLPGTELAFATPVRFSGRGLFAWKVKVVNHATAIFRQVNKDNPERTMMRWNFPMGRWCC